MVFVSSNKRSDNISLGVSFKKTVHLVTLVLAFLTFLSSTTYAQIDGEEFTTKKTCPIPPPRIKPTNPTMVASYPGSGAKLTWKLIRAISGYMTSDDAVDHLDLAKQRLVIAIKTHYPARGSNDPVFQPYADVPRSVLLIRNPMNAIPSFHSFLYEQSIGATGHSMRAPVDKWIEWRDRHFEQEIQYWLDHIMFWMEHHPFEDRFILPYEYLIKPGAGPTELRRLHSFLEDNIEGIAEMRTPIQKVDCIWDFIVMKREDEGTDVGSMRQGGPTVWPYTHDQINKIKAVLRELMLKWPGQLGVLMKKYLFEVLMADRN
mmetsp:Transcript_22390/g.25939  ORF Transcript_22390/g.25939 Transcript_22390/m.25939 type:complete len:317 (-) Transcript_22390:102-1052(-)